MMEYDVDLVEQQTVQVCPSAATPLQGALQFYFHFTRGHWETLEYNMWPDRVRTHLGDVGIVWDVDFLGG